MAMNAGLNVVIWVFKTFPFLREIGWVQRLVTKVALYLATKGVPSRPYPFAQTPEGYTSWYSLIDRQISGRHLPPPVGAGQLPSEADLVALSIRQGNGFETSARSSLLFSAFAQWFTDSFLRTAHGFEYDADGNPKIDPITKKTVRTAGRHAMNDSNHEIDLCQIYGMDEDKTKLLRTKKTTQYRGFLEFEMHGGQMFPPAILSGPLTQTANGKATTLPLKPRYVGLFKEELLRFIVRNTDSKGEVRSPDLFAVGLEHGNSTLGNSLFNVMFLREHNRVAKLIGDTHKNWSDEQVFQTTRNVLVVMLLKIVICDYIAHISPGNLPLTVIPGYADKKRWYRTNRIAIEFNLLYRWHEMVPNEFDFMPNPADYLHNNTWLINNGVESLIESLSTQAAGKIVLGNQPKWLKHITEDTISLMRASNFASYNEYRARFNMERAKKFEDITKDANRLANLKAAYPNGVDSVEWFIGMCAEDHGPDSIMGDLMRGMVAYDAFTQALTNPLLAKEVYGPETFSAVGLQEIENTKTLGDLVRRNVDPAKAATLVCAFNVP